MKIVLSTVVALFLLGCSENNTQHTQEAAKQTVEKTQETKQSMTQSVTKAQEALTQKAQEVSEKVQETTKELATQAKEKAIEVESVATEVVDENLAVIKAKAQELTQPNIDAAKLFNGCAACHGKDGSKSALNKSKVIKGWEKSKTVEALKGYQNGTYGGAMKGIMKGQAGKLNDDEINALAEYISKL